MSTASRRTPLFLAALVVAGALPGALLAQGLGVVSPSLTGVDVPSPRALDSAGDLYVGGTLSNNLVRIAPDGAVTTVFADGPAAPFLMPSAVATDASDDVYVACSVSDNVYRFAPDGTATVVVDATGDGLGHALDQPTTLAVVGQDVWVAGRFSHTVFHVSPTGVVTLVMDVTGAAGHMLTYPRVRAEAGRVFVLGTGAVFEVLPGGGVDLLLDEAGDGAVQFGTANDLCVDTAGTVFAADNNNVFSITPGGAVAVAYPLGLAISGSNVVSDALGSTWVSAFNPFFATSLLVELPPAAAPVVHLSDSSTIVGLTADDAGNVYWVRPQSVGSDWIMRLAPGGQISVILGQLGDGMGGILRGGEEPFVDAGGAVYSVGRISDNVVRVDGGTVTVLGGSVGISVPAPLCVHVDRDGRVIVGGEDEVVRYDLAAGTQEQILDTSGDGGASEFLRARRIASDHAGNVWVASRLTNNVFRITPAGVVTEELGLTGVAFQAPFDLAVDAQDNVYVAGLDTDNVMRIEPGGKVTEVLTAAGDGVHPLDEPRGVAVDGAGNLYVAGGGSDNVFRVTPGGVVTQIADAAGAGPGAPLTRPGGVAATWKGDVYVSGLQSHNVLHIAPGGAITEVMTSAGDGLGHVLTTPATLEVDGFGALYVTGQGSNNVFRRDTDGTITQLMDASGAAPYALLEQPFDVALDLSGNVFVAARLSKDVLSVTQDDWFTDLGGSAPGSNGRPTMWTKGDLTPGSSQDRVLTNVPPNALMLVWIAFTSTPFDAIGGTVHAFPFSRQVLFVADPTGSSELSLPWPAGIASGIDIYLQFIVQDPSVPDGLTLSNATMRTTP